MAVIIGCMVLAETQLDDGLAVALEGRGEAGHLPVSAVASSEHERMVRGYLLALTGDLAVVDDLSQEVFVRAIERLDLFAVSPSPARLLRGFARRVVLEFFRRRKRSRRYMDATLDTLAADDESVGGLVVRAESLARLRVALEELPIVSRRMLEMRYHDGMSAVEIGDRLGVSAGAVRVTLLRARERLRARLEAGELAAA